MVHQVSFECDSSSTDVHHLSDFCSILLNFLTTYVSIYVWTFISVV